MLLGSGIHGCCWRVWGIHYSLLGRCACCCGSTQHLLWHVCCCRPMGSTRLLLRHDWSIIYSLLKDRRTRCCMARPCEQKQRKGRCHVGRVCAAWATSFHLQKPQVLRCTIAQRVHDPYMPSCAGETHLPAEALLVPGTSGELVYPKVGTEGGSEVGKLEPATQSGVVDSQGLLTVRG
jgi:hypothetical protein